MDTKDTALAKDFIWEHLTTLSQEYFISISKMDEQTRHKLYAKKFEVYLQGDVNNGLIVNEIVRIAFPQ